MNKTSIVVQIQERRGTVRSATQHLSHELFHDGVFVGYYENKISAERASQMIIYGKVFS